MARPRDVVFHLQIALRVIQDPELEVDGLLGPETYNAYHDLEDHARAMIKSLYVDGSPFLRDRLSARRPQTPSLEFDLSEVWSAVEEVSKRLDVPRSYLRLMVKQENYVSGSTVRTTVEGEYRGIGQFDEDTWESVADRYRDLRMGPFEAGTKDVRASLLAAAALYLENEKTFHTRFPEHRYTDGIAYLFHQQGASAAIAFLRKGRLQYPEQSEASVELFEKERNSQFA